MKTKLQKLPPVILCAIFAVFLIKSPEQAALCVVQSLKLCAYKLIPSLFPFFVLSSLLRGTGIARILSRLMNKPFQLLFGVSGSGALPLILGFTGGYPVGVKTVCDMHAHGEISKKDASRLLLFCGNTGPAFIIGAAGAGLFASSRLGLILYAVHIAAALVIGIVCRMALGKTEYTAHTALTPTQSFAKTFTEAVPDSALSCINITAYVVLFSVFAGLLQSFGFTDILCAAALRFGLDPVHTRAVFTGFLELGSGIEALSPFAANLSFSLPACAFILGWGGISVHAQALAFITRENLPAWGYVLSKLFHGILSAVLVLIPLRCGGIEAVFAFSGHATAKAFIFDYLGLFFSVACALAALMLHIIRRVKQRKCQR
ncbi:MAG: sporulation protein [Oscillospiraceae bacterium]|nr:sporulation protein [Oscillospiraceae bacterium]